MIPLTGEKWVAHSEAYATLIAEHVKPKSLWPYAGTGSRILEGNLDALENWLVKQSEMTIGMDVRLTQHVNDAARKHWNASGRLDIRHTFCGR